MPLNIRQKRLAVLIDGDNASSQIVKGLFEEIAKYGVASVKRIYGDWTQPTLSGWKTVLLNYSIQPMQQFAYTTGKNSTDSSLIIDAMDLLYTRRFDGFCIVSSDCDFTRLAARIREEGLIVYGFGESKTPKPFVAACDKFIDTKMFQPSAKTLSPTPPPTMSSDQVDFLREVILGIDDEYVNLANLGAIVPRTKPDFHPRNFGFKNYREMLSTCPSKTAIDMVTKYNIITFRRRRRHPPPYMITQSAPPYL
eukprot:gene14766-17448_t